MHNAMLDVCTRTCTSHKVCHYIAGYNAYGQLGDNTTFNSPDPTRVVGNSTWASLPSHGWAYGYTCAIKTNASLWCWVSWMRRQSW